MMRGTETDKSDDVVSSLRSRFDNAQERSGNYIRTRKKGLFQARRPPTKQSARIPTRHSPSQWGLAFSSGFCSVAVATSN